MQGWSRALVHGLCLVLVIARLVHAYGVSQEHEDIRFRAGAIVTTFLVLAVASLLLLAGARL
jgi:uncharacterized membrane protein YecN with MAPEG domain